MLRCLLCAFDTEVDDTVVVTPTGRCICLRCFTRETNSQRLMSKQLRHDLVATLATLG